ncbi:MAG: succinate-semialdehyde dehydrogenase/glutarate-semialdehyde dehydrogenase [Candidatus Midichloriaceae bacterium]|jgi:succinate-semialdehyde dehydrogenase/glutarate-semialdehyde dehydrogenase
MKNIIETINPATDEKINEYQCHDIIAIKKIAQNSAIAQKKWSKINLNTRIKYIEKLSEILDSKKQHLAKCITNEMGKTISESIAEVEKCKILCDYYIENSEKFLKSKIIQTNFSKSYYTYQPLGVIFGIMPWNFPLWQVMRFVVPNLIIGNSILLKHASNTTGVSLEIEKFMKEVLPENLFRSLILHVNLVKEVIKDCNVAAVTITGSKKSGSSVAQEAGKNIKKSVLELGGNDPYIILEDADLDLAAEHSVKSRLLNTGQVCIAAKRIIICESIRSEFEKKVIALVKKYKYINPLLPDANLGPLAKKDIRETLSRQVNLSLEENASCIYKSNIPNGKGYYFPVMILNNVDCNNTAFKEELFGPVVCITSAQDEKEAIKYANMSEYGLSAVVFTSNITKGEYICANELNFGMCNLNSMVASDPRLPFGGIKSSGFGRELGEMGLTEFANIKTINIR